MFISRVLGVFDEAPAAQREFFERRLITVLLARARNVERQAKGKGPEAERGRGTRKADAELTGDTQRGEAARLEALSRLDSKTLLLDALLLAASNAMPRIPGLGPDGRLRKAWRPGNAWTSAGLGFECRLARVEGFDLLCRVERIARDGRIPPGPLRVLYRLAGVLSVPWPLVTAPFEPERIQKLGDLVLSPLARGTWSD